MDKAARKAAAIDSAKLRGAFLKSAAGREYAAIAMALYRHAMTDGIIREMNRRQTVWAPLTPRYLAWKKKKGLSPLIWEATGATRRAIFNNPPKKIGMNGKLKFGLNFRRDLAFARPMAFSKKLASKGFQKLANGDFQTRVYRVLRYGNAVSKLNSGFRKSQAAGSEMSMRGYVENAKGISRKVREMAVDGRGGLPGRPPMEWTPAIIREAEKDVAAQIAKFIASDAGKY